MQRFIYSLVLTLCAALQAHAQGNVLGLPAVPQAPVSGAQGPTPSASPAGKSAKPAASGSAGPQTSDAQSKAVLSGGVTLATSYDGRTATVVVTTNNTYQSEDQRKAALNAAKLVQRDVRLSCGKQCKAAPTMPVPKILPSGKLEFAMVVNDYPRNLSNDDVIALLLGNPLAVIPAAKAASAAPASPAVPAAPVPIPAASAVQ